MSEDEPICTERLIKSGWNQSEPLKYRVLNEDDLAEARAEFSRRSKELKAGPGKSWDGLMELMNRMTPQWKVEQPQILAKAFERGQIRRVRGDVDRNSFEECWQLVDDSEAVRREWKPRPHPIWIDVDQRGRMIFGEKGCLWAWAEFPDGEPRLVADLNANAPEQIAPRAWARRWAS